MQTYPLAIPSAVLVLILLQLASPSWGAARDQQAIDAIAAGTRTEARASWWGFDPDDATGALQAAINSGAKRVIVDNVGKPWTVGQTITLAGNQELFFERGVEVLAKKGAFKGRTDCLFRAELKENITLSGYGAALRMRRSDYDGPDYGKSEYRHVLGVNSCTNVGVYGLTLAESGGDGLYLGAAQEGVTNKNVHIKDVVCASNYRQGISVITAEDLLIENCTLRDTAGTAPQAGVDFEPNSPGERLVNCVMRNCVTQNNRGNGYEIYLGNGPRATPLSLRFEHCRSFGDEKGADIGTPGASETELTGAISFEGCTFERSRGSAIELRDKPAGGVQVRFTDCSILDPQNVPILLTAGPEAANTIGGMVFADCLVRDGRDRKPMDFVDRAGTSLHDISGRLILEKQGQHTAIPLTEKVIADWMPAAHLKPIPRLKLAGLVLTPVAEKLPVSARALDFVRLREVARLVLYAPQGDTVVFRLRHLPVANYPGETIPVMVVSPSGSEVTRVEAPFKQETEVTFVAPETGVYRISADPGDNFIEVPVSSHPMNLSGDGQPIHFYSVTGELFFWVPTGTITFGVRVSGDPDGEAIKAALVDPRGQVVEEADNILVVHQFEVTVPQPSAGEAWSLRLSKPTKLPMEDYYVDLRGIPPLLAGSRDALLRPASPPRPVRGPS